VHLLGIEYNRTVCVVPEFHFHKAFEPKDPNVKKQCDDFFKDHVRKVGEQRIIMVNYQKPTDECKLQEKLASDAEKYRVIFFTANTYVRWRTVPPNFFFKFYKPKEELLNILPYEADNPPKTVVHLRLEDSSGDARKGLSEKSLLALAEHLSIQEDAPYLVTNYVRWYDFFEVHFGWKHPNWERVIHSALDKDWGARKQDKAVVNKPPTTMIHEDTKVLYSREKAQQRLQAWSDWFAILTAKQVYHTHSDFSESAIHWMGNYPGTNDFLTWSRILMGTDPETDELLVEEEAWAKDKPMPPLVERVGSQLGHCRTKQPWKKNKYWEGYQTDLDLSSPVTRSFIEKSLTISPVQRAQYQEWREQNGGKGQQHHFNVQELTEKVTNALMRQQEAWDNEV
jgi:hypothetical protein